MKIKHMLGSLLIVYKLALLFSVLIIISHRIGYDKGYTEGKDPIVPVTIETSIGPLQVYPQAFGFDTWGDMIPGLIESYSNRPGYGELGGPVGPPLPPGF